MGKAHSVSTVAPHRISLVGGGSDLPTVSDKIGGGCVSFTIPKYIYVTCKRHSIDQFQERYRLQYSLTEVVNERSKIVNNIIRETLIYLDIDEPLVISTSSDLPTGSGLGSSSSFTVALLLALRKLFDVPTNPFELAEDAYQIERIINGNSVGRQDQFAASIGGYNYYQFDRDGSVSINPIMNSHQQISSLAQSSLLIWTGLSRSASTVLKKQSDLSESLLDKYTELNELTMKFYQLLKLRSFSVKDYGYYIRQNWSIKKGLASAISNSEIESIIEQCLRLGTTACKVLGAGGGGYILALGTNKQTEAWLESEGLHTERIGYDPNGARVLSSFVL